MESALMTTPRSFSASASASADLPLAVGPAMRMTSGSLTALTYCAFPRIKIPSNGSGCDRSEGPTVPIYEFGPNSINLLPETTFGSAGVHERRDLQRLLR